jgi:ubiquinone/menaquinone biosynthesis C-methylase UbiE
MTQTQDIFRTANFPELYERYLVAPLFEPWVDSLLRHADLARDDRVLDVACGTGIVARHVQQRLGDSGSVTGVDLNEQMLDVARARTSGIDWRNADALALPFAAESFDVVLCQQGLQFFPDRAAGAREMRRVLKPGGRLVVAVWRPLTDSSFFRDMHETAQQQLGEFIDRRHSFGDARALHDLLDSTGFHDIAIEQLTLTIRFDEPLPFLRLNATALVGMSPRNAEMSPDERGEAVEALIAASERVAARYLRQGTLAFDLAANMASARA